MNTRRITCWILGTLITAADLPAQVTNLASPKAEFRVEVRTLHPRAEYAGRLVGENERAVTLRLEGWDMTIPRTNIQDISYHRITPGPVSRTATHPPAAPGATNQGALTSLKTPAGQEAVQTVLADKIGNRSPEATQKYLGLVEGLQSGRTNLSDIRLQAGTLLRQLDELSRELDQEPGAELWREYKAILEDFVRRYDKGER